MTKPRVRMRSTPFGTHKQSMVRDDGAVIHFWPVLGYRDYASAFETAMRWCSAPHPVGYQPLSMVCSYPIGYSGKAMSLQRVVDTLKLMDGINPQSALISGDHG